MQEAVIVKDSDRMYKLVQMATGELCLEVVTGSFAMDVCKMYLNSEETRQFGEEGKSYVDDLAYRVSRQENEYKDRLLWD